MVKVVEGVSLVIFGYCDEKLLDNAYIDSVLLHEFIINIQHKLTQLRFLILKRVEISLRHLVFHLNIGNKRIFNCIFHINPP